MACNMIASMLALELGETMPAAVEADGGLMRAFAKASLSLRMIADFSALDKDLPEYREVVGGTGVTVIGAVEAGTFTPIYCCCCCCMPAGKTKATTIFVAVSLPAAVERDEDCLLLVPAVFAFFDARLCALEEVARFFVGFGGDSSTKEKKKSKISNNKHITNISNT